MAQPIEEFLVRLGFKIDEGQHRRFQDAMTHSHNLIADFARSMQGVLEKFAQLSIGATGAAVGVAASMVKIGESMAGLSREAQRLGASESNIDAFSNAIREFSGNAADAHAMLSNIAQHEINNPAWAMQFDSTINPRADRIQQLIQLGQHWRDMITHGQGQLAQRQATVQGGFSLEQFQELTNPRVWANMQAELRRQQQQGLQFGFMGKIGQDIQEQIGKIQARLTGFVEYLYQYWGPRIDKGLNWLSTWFDQNTPLIKQWIDKINADLASVPDWVREHWPQMKPYFDAALDDLKQVYEYLRTTDWKGILANLKTAGSDFVSMAQAIHSMMQALEQFNKTVLEPLAKKLGVPGTFIPAFEALAVFLASGRFLGAIRAALGPLGLLIAGALLLENVANKKFDPKTFGHGDPNSKWTNENNAWSGWGGKIWNWLQEPAGPSAFPGGSSGNVHKQSYIEGGGYGGLLHDAAYRALSPPGAGAEGQERYLTRLEAIASLPRGLLDRIWAQESGRGHAMVSSAGALGDFQLMPGTARQLGVNNPMNFYQAAAGAATYMTRLLSEFGGNIAEALAGYNWGPGNVENVLHRYGANWLAHAPAETQNYVRRIMSGYANGGMSAPVPRHYAHNVSNSGNTNVNINGVSDPDRAASRLRDQLDRRDQATQYYMRGKVI